MNSNQKYKLYTIITSLIGSFILLPLSRVIIGGNSLKE